MPINFYVIDSSENSFTNYFKLLNEESSSFKNIKEFILSKYSSRATFDINIQFFTMENLQNRNTYVNLCNSPYRKIASPEKTIHNSEEYFYPTISIGLENVMEINSKTDKLLELDRRHAFFDSSIWHRYIYMDENFPDKFEALFTEIKGYYDIGLYKTSVAKEYLEFQTRLLYNSYIANVGNVGHFQGVTPFKFHSETLYKEQFESKNKQLLEKLSWRSLLIDDHCISSVKSTDSVVNLNKNRILDNLIKNKLSIEIDNTISEKESNEERNFSFIDKAVTKLENNEMYDILFLDYYLPQTDSDSKPEYGFQLLEKITDSEQLKNNRGPFGKYWIFSISGFSEAMTNELHQKGISMNNELWNYDVGADPINTPHLFIYKLSEFLENQVMIVLYESKDILDFINFSYQKYIDNDSDDFLFAFEEFSKTTYSIFLDKFGKSGYLSFDDTTLARSINQMTKNTNIYKRAFDFFEITNSLLMKLAYFSTYNWKELLKEKHYFDDTIIRHQYDQIKLTRFNSLVNKYIHHISQLRK